MANPRMSLLEEIRKAAADRDEDLVKAALRKTLQDLIEAEVATIIGADRHERTEERNNQRNGHRERQWDTRVGTIDLQIPKLRKGSFFPSLLEPRRMTETALLSVVQQAYVCGVSTRKVDHLVRSLGLEGIDKSRVSRICKELDEMVHDFRTRPLEGQWPYLWLDATYLKVRQNGRVVSMAAVIAVSVSERGERRVVGFDLGPSEAEDFWLHFLREVQERGLRGLQLVISDAHLGLRKAIQAVFGGATWQRCRVHFMRNVLALVPKHAQPVVSAAVRTILAQPDQASALAQLERVADSLRTQFPKVASLLLEGAEDVLAYMSFPPEHWRQLHSTNPLERLNKEVKRRSDVVGIFPDVPSVLRLVGAILSEQNDEWETSRRYFSQESMSKVLAQTGTPETPTLPGMGSALASGL